jgi:hypothetical protein
MSADVKTKSGRGPATMRFSLPPWPTGRSPNLRDEEDAFEVFSARERPVVDVE